MLDSQQYSLQDASSESSVERCLHLLDKVSHYMLSGSIGNIQDDGKGLKRVCFYL